jgi:hypothetical protein
MLTFLQSPRLRLTGLGLALLLSASSQASCGDPPIGDLTVPFRVDLGLTCADFQVETVEVKLTPTGDDAEDNVVVTGTATCESGELVFEDVGVGQYKVTATGMYSDGVIAVDSIADGSKTAEVLEDQFTSSPALALGPTPAKLRLYWALNKDGKQAMCGDVFVASFEVSVLAGPTSAPLLEHEFKCADEGDEDLYRTALDPSRELDGSLAKELRIEFRNADGMPLGGIIKACFDAPGPGRNIEIDLECNDDICELASEQVCP